MTASHLIAVGILLCLTGCLGNHQGHPEERGPRRVRSQQSYDRSKPEQWRQIFLGSPPKPKHVGYVKTVSRGLGTGIHWIYDTDFRVIGRVSAKGQTVKLTRRGKSKGMGGFALHHAILRLHDRTKATEVNLVPMPDPRG